jgi:4'-phosphopantetheinyl transferase
VTGATWWRHLTRIEDVTIFAVELTADPARERRALDLLDATEEARYRRFRVDGARRQFLLSRAALRLLLSDVLSTDPGALAFPVLEHGKPYATIAGRPAPIAFNLSHSGDDALIALTPGRTVGVDIEHRRTNVDLDGVGSRVFGPSERQALSASRGEAKLGLFYRLWTFKEALIKARGTGFSYDPVRFEVPAEVLHGASSGHFGFPDDAASPTWVLTDLGCDGYAAAVAHRI